MKNKIIKTILAICLVLIWLPTLNVSSQTESEQKYGEVVALLTELTEDKLNNLSEYELISMIVYSINEGIEEIQTLEDDESVKVEWINELEKEGLLRIKNILLEIDGEEIIKTSNNADGSLKEDIPREFKNALGTAESYLNFMSFSKEGLYDQLIFGKYPEDAAEYAVENINVDWNENALKSALNYLDFMSISNEALYDQLIFAGYTPEQAQYAIDNLD